MWPDMNLQVALSTAEIFTFMEVGDQCSDDTHGSTCCKLLPGPESRGQKSPRGHAHILWELNTVKIFSITFTVSRRHSGDHKELKEVVATWLDIWNEKLYQIVQPVSGQ